MKVARGIFAMVAVGCAVTSPARPVVGQDAGQPRSAEKYAQSTEPMLKVIGALSRFILPQQSGALEFTADRIAGLNDARAQAEQIMNDPSRAFLPVSGGTPQSNTLPQLCGTVTLTCNPTNISFEQILASTSQPFRSECTKPDASAPRRSVSYWLVDCPQGRSGQANILKSISDWDGRNGYYPAPTQVDGRKETLTYKGYSFSDFCTPCRKPQPLR